MVYVLVSFTSSALLKLKQPSKLVDKCSLDNSEFNRNGDFAPSRWESQNDAATNICDVKMQQNPENTLAVMS